MIKPDSKYLRSLPERYFAVPKNEKVDPNTLGLAIYRIGVVVEALVSLECSGYSERKVQDIAFLLEGLVYQAKQLAGEI